MDQDTNLNICTWNAHSMYNKLSELKMFLYTKRPHLVCIQETWQRREAEPNFINYQFLVKHRVNNGGGGIGVLIRSDIIITNDGNLNMYPNGNLEIQKVQIQARRTKIDIMNIYNHGANIAQQEYNHYFQQLGNNSIIVGDFNAHHEQWDTRHAANISGSNLIAAMAAKNLQLLTPQNMPTYLDNRTGRPSTLDLVMLSSNLYPGATIQLAADLGSDHGPVLASMQVAPSVQPVKIRNKWSIDKNKWEIFQ